MMGEHKYRQPWLHNAAFDGTFILLPGLLALLITLLLPDSYKQTDEMPVAGWVILILLVDVAHVYSTLFRTYWDKQRFARHRTLYIAVPIACYVTGILLYSIDALVFWRILAYLAVYHFIRQQYGFMRLYSRYEEKRTLNARIDAIAIYAATLYPLIYWHCTPGRNFNWFVAGDFISSNAAWLKQAALYLYVAIIVCYLVKEVALAVRTQNINVPKNMVIIITCLSWYFGIVYFNGDMAFTLLNVVVHGIPYMALIWLFKQKERGLKAAPAFSMRLPQYTLLFFLGSIFLLSYLEEGLWDGLVWREHGGVFGLFSYLPAVSSNEVLALLIPLLSLPQSTHYVLDGFIWRREKVAA